jgi:hypothetical protein
MSKNGLLSYITENKQPAADIKNSLFIAHINKTKIDAVKFKAQYLSDLAGTDLHKKEEVFAMLSDTIAAIPGDMLQEEYAKIAGTILKVKYSLLLKKAKAYNEVKNGRDKRDIENDLKRAKHVADQAERREMDITKDEADFKDITDGLASLGEPARFIFHRICAIRPEYLKSHFEPLFDQALHTRRARTAIKFFKVAQAYDLEVRVPKTIKEYKDKKSANEIIGDDKMADDYLKYAIWEENGVYKSLDQYETPYIVSNFTMRILWHVETGDDVAYRLIAIENEHGHKAVINMNTDDFESVGSFKKQVARKGNFIWKGNDVDLTRIKDKLQREEKPTKLVRNLGWNKRGKFYAWANGIYDVSEDKFIPVDEYGIVAHHTIGLDNEERPQNYFIPAMSKIYADKDELFANDKKFIYQQSSSTFTSWSEKFCTVYGHQGEITLVYYLMALFSDIVFIKIGERFPILNIYGKRGTGKGTMAQSIVKLFGLGQSQIMLGGAATVVGFMRKFAQFINAIVWLDEYKNNLAAKIIESIKNIYDRTGYERGKKDNTFDTESTPVHSACILSGQEMPTIEPALFSRVILLILTETKFNDKQRELKRELDKMEESGLSHITTYLMRHRSLVAEKFLDTYDIELKRLIADVDNNEVDDRIFVNYASVIAIAEIVDSVETLPFNMISFRTLIKQTLLEQFFVLKGSDDVSKFWEVVQSLFTEGLIQDGKHFLIKNALIYIRVGELHQAYSKRLIERKDPNGLDQQTLYKYLESDPKAFHKKDKKWFAGVGSQLHCHVFKYAEVGIDLIRADTEEQLKQRYKDLKIAWVEEEQGELDLPEPDKGI